MDTKMRGVERQAIQALYRELVQDVRAQDIVDDLFADNVISFHTKEKICVGETSRDKSSRLVDSVLQSPLYEAFDKFIQALNTNNHTFLAANLENELKRQKRKIFKSNPNREAKDESEKCTSKTALKCRPTQEGGGSDSDGVDEVDMGNPNIGKSTPCADVSPTLYVPQNQTLPAFQANKESSPFSQTVKRTVFCTLSRRDNESYGFKIISGIGRPRSPGDLDYYVTEVTPGSIAEQQGLRRNDTVLEVNDSVLRHISYDDVIHVLKTVTRIKLKIVRVVKHLNRNRESVYV